VPPEGDADVVRVSGFALYKKCMVGADVLDYKKGQTYEEKCAHGNCHKDYKIR
jgi:hypothetical protein